jgi:hypothetical protein
MNVTHYCIDPTGLLKEGQICFAPKDGIVDSVTGTLVGQLNCDVIVRLRF